MKILHISSDFAKQKIYTNLIRSLSIMGISQLVYVPVRSKSEINVNMDETIPNVKYKFSHILNICHRVNYLRKIKDVFLDLINSFDIQGVDLIHAHFLFSDGGVALKVKRKYGIKYVVAVRNTDINYFYKYGYHLRQKGNEILKNAEAVIFISPGHKEKLTRRYLNAQQTIDLKSKEYLIPNGIEEFWLKNTFLRMSKPIEQIGIIYYGEYSKNKNLETLIEGAHILIRKYGLNIELTLIGEYGDNAQKIIRISTKFPWIKTYPKMTKEELLIHLRKSQIFVMASFRETFGLVYIEALSQGLPIIYTKGEGIDGYFNEGEVGYSVNPKSAEDMASKVLDILNTNYVDMSQRCTRASQNFNWNGVSDDYMNLYKHAVRNEI